ncbi:LLM class flavin-dependent oxidoreductase [Mycobacterium sp.]|uniref:LLM class flavin-dependent oxidoreductase n=1 Tax=Mycobacterium sp. TaxID=1785 RepID=UPI003BB1456D
MTTEAWTLLPNLPRVASRDAAAAEREGWTGVLLADSQNLAAELVVEMAMCVAATSRVMVSPGVTNSVTRHPAVLAGAMATLQAESSGRISVDIGRGDSALAHLGFAPMGVKPFGRYVTALRTYLRGGEVDFDPGLVPANIKALDTLNLGEAPSASRLGWIRPNSTPVPVNVSATGPRVIALGAVLADGVSLSVGGDPDRVAAAIDVARTARVDAGLDPDGLAIGAYLNIAVHDDLATAAHITSGKLASFSRFSVMHGAVTGFVSSDDDRKELSDFHGTYDMTAHGRSDASHLTGLSVDFAQRNAVIGSAPQVLERLWELKELGVSRFLLTEDFVRTGPSGESHSQIVEAVLPELLGWS